ncbi:MAG TPA: 3-oxoacyl-[acyl-carrier-protein] reductase [Bacteroidales bacterium]|nr:3-oxoacyl-[acyl-carrier-protein] reductase [Bacteroidales bacterium]
MKLLEGKTALITGAARGIGRGIALRLATEGANIAFSDIRIDEDVQKLEKQLAALGVKAKGYASDAASFDEAEKLVNDVKADFGSIEILVNNAGITRDNLLMRMTEADWDLVIKVNLKSIFNMTKAIQKVMLKQRFGSIINMSSVVGLGGNAGQSNYAASKAGLIGFTKSIAQELGSRNIRCNAIAPGFIETDMTAKLPQDVREEWAKSIPLRRAGKPEDVANVALFLASELSAYVTGQVISVCGGMSK